MSRRRCTTAKMFSGRQGGPKPTKNGRQSQSRPSAADQAGEGDDRDESLEAEPLERQLAAEALPSDFGEERTAWWLKRYFRLNLALAGINILVAGTTLGALWTHFDKQPEASRAVSRSVAQPKPVPAAAPAPTVTPVPLPAPLPPAPVDKPSASPPGALSPPPGAPPAPSSKREALASVPKIRRAAVKPRANPPAFNRPNTEEDEAVVLNSVVERW